MGIDMVIYAVRTKLGNLILGRVEHPYILNICSRYTLSVSSIFLNNHSLLKYDTKNGKVAPPFSSVIFYHTMFGTQPFNINPVLKHETRAFIQRHFWVISNQWTHTHIYIDAYMCHMVYVRGIIYFLHVQCSPNNQWMQREKVLV